MATALPQTSSQLNRVLDAYGLSRSFTDYRRQAFTYVNSLFGSETDMLSVLVGSKRDALCSFLDTESDMDVVCILPASVFDERNQDEIKRYVSTQIKKEFPVFILENGPSPGYKYLKCLVKGDRDIPYTYTHFRGFTYLLNTNKSAFIAKNDTEFQCEVHGPALSTSVLFGDGEEKITFEFDAVMAFHCPFLPTDFDEWCNRKRHHQWPPKWIIETTKKYGCLVVPVGHQTSDTQVIEWRLSLTKTENLLTKSFNHIQMKCYAMLRLVLKWIIQPQMKEPLSSYHVKTVMFWMSEEREKRFWIRENLFDCFISSMMKLKTYVKNKYCPNYFLTAVNLLEGKLEGDVHRRVLEILEGIIGEGPAVVYRCLPLNAHMNGARCRHRREEACICLLKHLLEQRIDEIDDTMQIYWCNEAVQNGLFTTVNADLYRSCYIGLIDWYVINEFQNRSVLDSKTFSSLSVCEEMGLSNKRLYSLQKKYIAKLRGNEYVARIKLATLFYHRRRLGCCLPLLSLVIKSIESSRKFEVCTERQTSSKYEEIEGVECIYLTQNNKGFSVSEIVFGPCDKCLIPHDLQDEMGRPKTVNGTYYEGWVFVDSIVYAYYLLILTLHDLRRYRCITSLFRRFHKVCTQKPGAIRIFRKDMARRLYSHAFMLVWASTKGFTRLST